MEEEYFRDLRCYYDSLQMGLLMDYYQGRHDPDLTPWLSYFLETMATEAGRVRDRALELHEAAPPAKAPWEDLSRRQQQLLSRLVLADPDGGEVPTFTLGDLAEWFMVSGQTARSWLQEWHEVGFVVPASGGQRVRAWSLSKSCIGLVASARNAGGGEAIA